MSGLDEFFVMLAELLHDLVGLDVSAGLLSGIFFFALAAVAVAVIIRAGRAVVQLTRTATGFARKQVDNRFWEDAGKLASVISFLLLLLAYGLFWGDQRRTLDEALLDMGRQHLAEIVPTAILTQVVLLSAYWFIFGRLTAVSTRTLLEPYRLVVGFAVVFAWLLLASVVPFVLAGGNAETLGMAVLGLITVLGIGAALLVKSVTVATRQAQRGKAKASIAVAVVGLLLLTGLVATTVAAIYAGVSSDPSVGGLVATDFAIMTVLLLFTGYRFRAYIGRAEVPTALPHLIDFSLAISACAIALAGLAGLAGSSVMLGGVPPVVIAAGPALAVAAMIYIVHLRQSRLTLPRWGMCLAVAIVAGLLVGPLKALLAEPIAAFASVLPVNWG